MAIFKANDLCRIVFKSHIRQLLALNGFTRECQTFNNPFKRFQKNPNSTEEQSGDLEKRSDRFQSESGVDGEEINHFERKSSGYDRPSGGFERKFGGFKRSSGGYDNRSSGFENRSDRFENRSDRFDNRSDRFDNRSDRFDNRSDRFENRSGRFEHRSRGFENGFSGFEHRPDYYRTRKEDVGKLRNGVGSESEWFTRRNIQIKLPDRLSGAKIMDQPFTVDCNNLEFKTWNKFSEIENLDPRLAEVLTSMGHSEMSPIQKQTFDILNRKLMDILGSAETGSGKTLAFLVPILNSILSIFPKKMMEEQGKSFSQSPLMLVMAPTRELVQQISEETENLLQLTPLRVCSVIGGVHVQSQIVDINRGCHVLIATPGRLIDLLSRQLISLRYCTNLVIDEADRMLDMGFEPQIGSVVFEADLPKENERQTSMFSATFPNDVMQLARQLLKKNYGKILIGSEAGSRDPTIPKSISQSFIICSEFAMMPELFKLLDESDQKTIVFCNKKIDVISLVNYSKKRGIKVSSLHGDLGQHQRDNELESFKNNTSRVLIATSIASRGIDVADVERVVNFTAPQGIDDYIHRVGRCGRMGRPGHAITIATSQQMHVISSELIKVLHKCGQPIPDCLTGKRVGHERVMGGSSRHFN